MRPIETQRLLLLLFHMESVPEEEVQPEPNSGMVAPNRKEILQMMEEFMQSNDGQTPDEVFFGIGDGVANKLSEARKTAREERMRENRAARCGRCTGEVSSGPLLLQRPRSRMS